MYDLQSNIPGTIYIHQALQSPPLPVPPETATFNIPVSSGFNRYLHLKLWALEGSCIRFSWLEARPCDEDGNFLPDDMPPPLQDNFRSWEPFESRSSFELAELTFEKAELSAGEADQLLRIWAAREIEQGRLDEDNAGPFRNSDHLLATIDSIEIGDAPWHSFTIRYTGEVDDQSPSWKRQTYTVHTRDSLAVLRSMLGSTDFHGHFNYQPFKEYVGPDKRRWSDLLSGSWAWKQSVRSLIHIHVSYLIKFYYIVLVQNS